MLVKKLICGATFRGVGEAIADPKETLIVDRNAVVGHEFIECLNPGTGWDGQELTEQGRKFNDELMKRNILAEDGNVHLPAVYPLLCQVIDQAGLNVLFMTEIVRIEEDQNGLFDVTLHNASGFHTVKAETIVDTTSEGLSYAPANRPIPKAKTINAYLLHEDKEAFPEHVPDGMVCLQGRFPAEVIGKFELSPLDQWVEAREKLHQFWADRLHHLHAWTLTTVAGSFDISVAEEEFAKRQSPGWRWTPSCRYDNLLAAFDSAFLKAERGTTA